MPSRSLLSPGLGKPGQPWQRSQGQGAVPALPGWLPSRQAAKSWGKGARDGNPQGGSPCGDGRVLPPQHPGIAGTVLEMPIGAAALAVGLRWPGIEMGSTAAQCWHSINRHPVATDGLGLETRRMGVPWEQVALATPLPLGPGGIQDGLGDIVTLPVALAPWWMGSGAI